MKTLNISFNPFEKLDKEWALVTCGDKTKFNTMTISWGGFGVLWHKMVATIYIRPSRYTFEFLKNNDYFTISFFDSKYKPDLAVLGSLSGRDEDKLKKTKLTPKFLANGVGFKEANLTFVCKKIYIEQMNLKHISQEIASEIYNSSEKPHYMIIGEIIKKL